MSKKNLSEYDFTPDQELVSKSNASHSTDTPMSVRFFMMVLLLLFGLFFIGHAVGAGAGLFQTEGSFSELVLNHIKEAPMDFLHFSAMGDGAFFLVWTAITLIYMFPADANAPKAEMKGEEHGSNDFQSIPERQVFMKRCSTGINMLDVNIVKAYEKAHTEGGNK